MQENHQFNVVDITDNFDGQDIKENSAIAGIAYFIFFLPLIINPNSSFARYHVNQSLLILLSSLAVGIVGGVLSAIFHIVHIPIIGVLFSLVIYLARLAIGLGIFVLWLVEMIDAFNGKAKKYPIIGDITLIK